MLPQMAHYDYLQKQTRNKGAAVTPNGGSSGLIEKPRRTPREVTLGRVLHAKIETLLDLYLSKVNVCMIAGS